MSRPRSVYLSSRWSRLGCLISWVILIALGIAAYIFDEYLFPGAIVIPILVSFFMIFYSISIFAYGVFVRPKRGSLTLFLGFADYSRGKFSLENTESIHIVEKESGFQFIVKDRNGDQSVLFFRFHRFSYWQFLIETAQYHRLKHELRRLNQYLEISNTSQ